MMRALCTTHPGAGHWRPLLPLAHALQTAGHQVAFATTPGGCTALETHGVRCFSMGMDDLPHPLPASPNTRSAIAPAQAVSVWVEQFAGRRAEASIPDLLAIGRRWRPSLIVRDISEFGGCVVAERLGIPHAAVQVSAYRPHLHQIIAPRLGRLRASVGLPPGDAVAMLYRYLLLAPVPPSFQPVDTPLPPTTHAFRSLADDREPDTAAALPARISQLPPRPTIYATLGTAYNWTPGLFAAILTALEDEPVNLIVTLGPGLDLAAFGDQPPHVVIDPYIPQSLLLPRCDLVITHGGFGTVMAALGHGLPMVVLPIAADMPDNARRCAELGLARVIAPDQRSPGSIRQAVRAVLDDPRYRRNAERLRDEFVSLPGLAHAVSLLARLDGERRPLDQGHRR